MDARVEPRRPARGARRVSPASARIVLLGSLYLSQGLPFGFFTQAVPVLLRQQGASLPEIGLANLLALPWALKFLWAPLVDRVGAGRRRVVLLPLQALAVAVLVGLAFVDPARGVYALLVATLLSNLVAATQDIATDALAVDTLPPQERGVGNGVQVAGYRLGMVLGGGALLVLFERIGWTASFLAMAALLALASVPAWRWREAPPGWSRGEEEAGGVDWAALAVWWRASDTAAWLLLLATFKLGDALATAMVRPMLVDAGLSMADLGWMLGALGSAMGLVGALAGGWLAGRVGRRPALVACGLLQSATLVGYAWAAAHPSLAAFWVAGAAEHLFGGMATAALFTAMMDACRPARAATDYTLQASVVVAATGGGALVSGWLAERVGYPGHFLLAAAIGAAAVALVASFRARGGGLVPRLEAA